MLRWLHQPRCGVNPKTGLVIAGLPAPVPDSTPREHRLGSRNLASTAFAWREPQLTSIEKRQRALLRSAIRLGHKLERAARLRSFRPSRERDWVRLVAYGHVVRAIQVCKGIHDLRENPVEMVLMRTLLELYVNLRYITLDPSTAPEKARNFHDFGTVSAIQHLLGIVARLPHIPRPGDESHLREQLRSYETRFKHGRSWAWDKRDLIARVESIGKAERAAGRHDKETRIAALYKECNPYVHSGMNSLYDSITRGGGMDAVRPKLRATKSSTSIALLASALIADLLLVAGEALNVSAYEKSAQALSDRSLRLSKEISGR